MAKKFDFTGWATKNNVRCSDGRTIRQDAFKENDGCTVPLVWNHLHNDPNNVLGHALLENRKEGVYAYCTLNDTESGMTARELIKHGDIKSLSIYANQLKQNGGDVLHGAIREVSLVLAGANPGAMIDGVIAHGEESSEEAVIYSGEEIELKHSDEENGTEQEERKDEKSMDPNVENKLEHAEDGNAKEKTIGEILETLTKEQMDAVSAVIGQLLLDENEEKEEKTDMKQNVFQNDVKEENVLTHSEFAEIVAEAKKNGSMKEAFLAHGITDVGNLFPEAQFVSNTPDLISRDMGWVSKVMDSVHKSPFSKIKSAAINVTAENARAKGYAKGNQKVEEVVAALKRTTSPTTIYKLQKMDRDDVIDITDFDVIAWIKNEMRALVEEELARAILIGDGRLASDNDKIDPLNIRPILGDSATYSIPKYLQRAQGEDDYAFAKNLIKAIIKSRKEYKGSGNPTFYTSEDVLTNMLLIEDVNGRVIYDTVEKLATALRVKEIVTVPVFENVTRTDESETFNYALLGILVNLKDYTVGADKGGALSMFNDFDLNFNKYEYLMETRCSGALTKPYSAITFEEKSAVSAGE